MTIRAGLVVAAVLTVSVAIALLVRRGADSREEPVAGPPATASPAREEVPTGPWRRDYPIVYVHMPRHGDDGVSIFLPDSADRHSIDAGGTLVLLAPDGREEVLFDGGPLATAGDPSVSLDGTRIAFTVYRFDPVRSIGGEGQLAREWLRRPTSADLHVVDVATREVRRLTWQARTPNASDGEPYVGPEEAWGAEGVDRGVFNLSPCWVPGDRILYTSTQNGFRHGEADQLFLMDADGRNLELVGSLNLARAAWPALLADGRVAWTSWESMGLRSRLQFGIWESEADGSDWRPLTSAFASRDLAFQFPTALPDGRVAFVASFVRYNDGTGALVTIPRDPPGPDFHRGLDEDVPAVPDYAFPFARRGAVNLFPLARAGLEPAALLPRPFGRWWEAGKFAHPAAAPGGDLLVTYSAGPSNWKLGSGPHATLPGPGKAFDTGIRLLRGGRPISHPDELVPIVDRPDANEIQARAVVPWSAVHGEPPAPRRVENDGSLHASLPAGTPFGLVGTSSMRLRDARSGVGPSDPLFDAWEDADPAAVQPGKDAPVRNWSRVGAEAGRYGDDDVWGVRLLALEPSGGHQSVTTELTEHERVRVLSEFPIRTGDSSWLALVPADTPFTFQAIDRFGMVLTMAQTWHQVRPGEVKADCGGCHAHGDEPVPFEASEAARPGFPVEDAARSTSLLSIDEAGRTVVRIRPSRLEAVEFERDVRPILERRCVSCHGSTSPDLAHGLALDGKDVARRLLAVPAAPEGARWLAGGPRGSGRVLDPGSVPPGARLAPYVRPLRARQSYLVWKISGRRLDGRSNEDRGADTDFRGQPMPPPDSPSGALTWEERLTIVRWIETGCAVQVAPGEPFADDLRPTLSVAPTPDLADGVPERVAIGVFDVDSGIDPASFRVTRRGGELLRQGVGEDEPRVVVDLRRGEETLELLVEVADRAGNRTTRWLTYRPRPGAASWRDRTSERARSSVRIDGHGRAVE